MKTWRLSVCRVLARASFAAAKKEDAGAQLRGFCTTAVRFAVP
jgi:hypothetical protein